MKTYCAWCGREMDADKKPVGDPVENQELYASHGLCRDCYPRVMAEFEEEIVGAEC